MEGNESSKCATSALLLRSLPPNRGWNKRERGPRCGDRILEELGILDRGERVFIIIVSALSLVHLQFCEIKIKIRCSDLAFLFLSEENHFKIVVILCNRLSKKWKECLYILFYFIFFNEKMRRERMGWILYTY